MPLPVNIAHLPLAERRELYLAWFCSSQSAGVLASDERVAFAISRATQWRWRHLARKQRAQQRSSAAEVVGNRPALGRPDRLAQAIKAVLTRDGALPISIDWPLAQIVERLAVRCEIRVSRVHLRRLLKRWHVSWRVPAAHDRALFSRRCPPQDGEGPVERRRRLTRARVQAFRRRRRACAERPPH